MCLRLRQPESLQAAIASLSDSELDRLFDSVTVEEHRRHQQRVAQQPILSASNLFKKAAATGALLALLAMPLGCAIDMKRPSVTFEAPNAWNCNQITKLPTKQGIEECSVCRNVTKAVQVVVVNKARQSVSPEKSVFICSTQAFVEP
jgi:hypothetical protein